MIKVFRPSTGGFFCFQPPRLMGFCDERRGEARVSSGGSDFRIDALISASSRVSTPCCLVMKRIVSKARLVARTKLRLDSGWSGRADLVASGPAER